MEQTDPPAKVASNDQLGATQPEREHVASEECWCEPTVEYVAENGARVLVHRRLQ